MIEVLKRCDQILAARQELRKLGCDTSVGWRRLAFECLYFLNFRRRSPPVALEKSWDILKIVSLADNYFGSKSARVFDMGSFNSEAPLALWQRGYKNIRAADLNPDGRSIRWYLNNINFNCEDFYHPDLAPKSLDLITSVSVIEHGYDRVGLIGACSRLLAPGGLLLITTDYSYKKIHVPEGFRLFGLPFMIFSRQEVEDLVSEASKSGLELLGKIDLEQEESPISFAGYNYTFVFLAFRKIGCKHTS